MPISTKRWTYLYAQCPFGTSCGVASPLAANVGTVPATKSATNQPAFLGFTRGLLCCVCSSCCVHSYLMWEGMSRSYFFDAPGHLRQKDEEMTSLTPHESSATPTPPPAPVTTFETLATNFHLRAPDAGAGCGQGRRRRASLRIRRCSTRRDVGGSSRW